MSSGLSWGQRLPLPDSRASISHSVEIAGMEVSISCGLYDDGKLGEIFTYVHCTGDCEPAVRDALPTVRGLLDAWAVTASIALQYGTPLRAIHGKIIALSFPPDGFVSPEAGQRLGIHRVQSILDYVARWLGYHFDLDTGVSKRLNTSDEGGDDEQG